MGMLQIFFETYKFKKHLPTERKTDKRRPAEAWRCKLSVLSLVWNHLHKHSLFNVTET